MLARGGKFLGKLSNHCSVSTSLCLSSCFVYAFRGDGRDLAQIMLLTRFDLHAGKVDLDDMKFDELNGKTDWAAAAGEFCRKATPIAKLLSAIQACPARAESVSAQRQREQQIAGYVLLHVHRSCPAILDAHLEQLLDCLDPAVLTSAHSSTSRQIMTVMQDRAVPERLAAKLFDRAAELWLDNAQHIGTRARALQVLGHLADQYPGLGNEVVELARLVPTPLSPGLSSMRKRILQRALHWQQKASDIS